jgi:hypothetical protein
MLPMGLSLGVYKKQLKNTFLYLPFDFKDELKTWHKVMGVEKVPSHSRRKTVRKSSTRKSKR